MIEVYSWPTPNGQKVHIAIEELGLPSVYKPVNIGEGEQFSEAFLAINPNHRIPAIVDDAGPGGEPISLFESGAILIYLAEKAGRLIPNDAHARYICLQWLMFQMSGIGPMFGQLGHFAIYAPEKIEYAITRYAKEAERLTKVLNKRLGEAVFLAGRDYSIADIATYPWIHGLIERGALDMAQYPEVARWHAAIGARPAVVRGMAVMAELRNPGPMSEEQRKILFGDRQHEGK